MHANEKVLRTALEALGRGDREAAGELMDENMVVHFPGSSLLAGDHRGRGAFNAKVVEITGKSLQIEVHDVLGSDDHAVGIYVMTAERDGKTLSWRHVNVYHVRDGKIVEAWQNPLEQAEVDEFFS